MGHFLSISPTLFLDSLCFYIFILFLLFHLWAFSIFLLHPDNDSSLLKFQFYIITLGKPSLRQHMRAVSAYFLLPYISGFLFSEIHQISNYCFKAALFNQIISALKECITSDLLWLIMPIFGSNSRAKGLEHRGRSTHVGSLNRGRTKGAITLINLLILAVSFMPGSSLKNYFDLYFKVAQT